MGETAGVSGHILVRERLPLIVVEFVGAPDDTQFAGYLAQMEAIVERQSKRPFDAFPRRVVIYDSTRASRAISAAQRRMQADYMKRLKRTYGDDSGTGVCFVLKSAPLRGALMAVLWLQPMSHRYKVVATREAADAWAQQWLSGVESVPPPPAPPGVGAP